MEEEGLYLRFLSATGNAWQVRSQDFSFAAGGGGVLTLKLRIIHVSFEDML
jgi:hypothetical protein